MLACNVLKADSQGRRVRKTKSGNSSQGQTRRSRRSVHCGARQGKDGKANQDEERKGEGLLCARCRCWCQCIYIYIGYNNSYVVGVHDCGVVIGVIRRGDVKVYPCNRCYNSHVCDGDSVSRFLWRSN